MANKAKKRANYLDLPSKRKASTKQAIDSSYTIAQPVYKNIDLYVLTGGQRKVTFEKKSRKIEGLKAGYAYSSMDESFKRKDRIRDANLLEKEGL